MKYLLILLVAILIGGSAPAPAPRGQYEIHGTVYGVVSSGSSAPIGEFIATGATVEEAAQHARELEAGIRLQATAQAVR